MRVSLHGGCDILGPKCRQIASSEYEVLHPDYTEGQAALRIEHPDAWLAAHRTARRRALRADRLGYTVKTFEPRDWSNDIFKINRSAPERQGREMADHYWNYQPVTGVIGPMTCPRHHRLEYGIFDDHTLQGYAGIIRCGELAHVSMFLGHAARLDDGIMYALLREVVYREFALAEPIVLYYNRYDSGTDGLRFFKDRIGLVETDIEWSLTT